ncbi:Oxysterol-binding protein-related protein 3 [Taenia solium]|eukprot:TsM_000534100 transcript=TsM_000534100 gene=TsM_000534100
MNLFKNSLQPTSNRSLDLPEVSFLSAPINSTARPHSHSVHDLRSLDGALGSTEMDLSGNRRAIYRARKNRRLDDSFIRQPPTGSGVRITPYPVTDQQCLKNSSSESVIDGQSLSRNRLTVPFSSGVSSTISQTRSSSSHGSMECLDGSTRKPPEPLQGVLLKNRKRPMKGWHERFFALSNGCLSYAKNQSLLTRGRNRTQIDLANTYVTSEPDKLKIDIDASAVVYHLKFEEAAKFRQWLTAIKEHRSYDQYQSAITSSGRSNANPTVCCAASNLNGDGIIFNNTCPSSPDTPDVGQVPARPNNIGLRNAPPAVQLKVTKATNRMSNEHIAAMEKLVLRLENAYQELAKAQSMLLEANIPENDPTEVDNSSPTRSIFFSPVPFSSFEGRTSSTVTEHRRISSISSITSMCTAVQGPTTDEIDPRSTNKNHVSASNRAIDFVRAAAEFSDEAKRFIEEANEALATIQQINQLCNNGLTPNKERKQVQPVNNKVRRRHFSSPFPLCLKSPLFLPSYFSPSLLKSST